MGDVRGDLPQHIAQRAVVRQQLVGREAGEVQLLARVGVGRRGPRRQDLLEGVVALRPEGRSPGGVERLDAPVAVLEPGAERLGGAVREVMRDMAAQLVVHMPQRERRMLAIALGHHAGHPQRILPEHRRGDGVGLPSSLAEHRAVLELGGQDLGMAASQPRRRGGRRGGGERDPDTGLRKTVHRLVEPAEVVLPSRGSSVAQAKMATLTRFTRPRA